MTSFKLPLPLLALLIAAAPARALTWDTAPGGTATPTGDGTVTGGTGSWDMTTYNWTSDNGTSNTLWTNGSDASFNDAGGTVTVNAAISANSVTLAPTSGAYTLFLINSLTNASALSLNTGDKLGFAGYSGSAVYNGNINLNGGVLYTGSGNTATINGLFTGGGDLVMNYAAVSYGNAINQTRTNLSNTYAGNTVLVNNVLQFNSYNTTGFTPFGSTTNATVSITSHNQWSGYNGAGVIFNPSDTGSTYTVTQNIALSASNGTSVFIQQNDGITRLTGNVSVTTDGNAASTAKFITQYNAKDIFIDGVLSGSGNVVISDLGGAYGVGSVHLTNANNTFSGTLFVNASSGSGGILTLENANAARYATVDLSTGTVATRLWLKGSDATVAGLTGSSTGAIIFTTDATVRTLTVNSAQSGAYAGQIGVSGSFNYDGYSQTPVTTNGVNIALNKSGAGALTLTGTNAYSGGTTVAAGSLITGNLSALGTGAVTVTGGTLQIGDGVTKTVALGSGANLVINGGTLKIDSTLGTGTAAILLSGGKYTFNGTLDLSGVFNSAGPGSYLLISGGTGNVDTSVIISGYANAGYNASFANGFLVLTAIPEPSAYGLLGAGALAATALVRRRKRA